MIDAKIGAHLSSLSSSLTIVNFSSHVPLFIMAIFSDMIILAVFPHSNSQLITVYRMKKGQDNINYMVLR